VKSTQFVTLIKGRFQVTPGVVADCAVLTFNAESVCGGPSNTDRCLIRALANGVEMEPAPDNEDRIFDSESTGPTARSYTWVKRGLLTGDQTFAIQIRVAAPGTTFVVDDWLLFIQYNS
jgi:hypothetical protein